MGAGADGEAGGERADGGARGRGTLDGGERPAGGALADGVLRREVWAWAMYDFANSGYTTVVLTAIFNAYFVATVAGGAVWATFAWTAALSASYAVVMAAAPALGAYADAYAAKKRLLVFTTVGCVAGTSALALVGPGMVAWAVALVIVTNVLYSFGEMLIAAFLPELAKGEAVGKVSGWGWSLGYIGGLIGLGLCLAYVSAAQARGETAASFVPVTMLITAGLFALAALPSFVMLRERALPQAAGGGSPVATAFARLARSAREASRYRDFVRLLLCGTFYQAGITAVITLAAIYAQEVMRFTMVQTLELVLIVNVTAAVGAFAFGYVQDRLGHVRSLAVTLLGWIVMTVVAWSSTRPAMFWVAANIAGLCMGSSQSAGRAFVAWLAPTGRVAEFFGLWNLATRLAAVLGPITYGTLTLVSGGDHRLAILVTGAYFVAGLACLVGLDAARGRRAALEAEDRV